MTKKDYELIANAIYKVKQESGSKFQPMIYLITESISEALAKENPRFIPDRFRLLATENMRY